MSENNQIKLLLSAWKKNINIQIEHSFRPWQKNDLTLKEFLIRNFCLLISSAIVIIWPINSVLINSLLLLIYWVLIGLFNKPIPQYFTIQLLLFNILVLFQLHLFLLP